MSKSALKKELKGFSAEQLSEMILNIYDSSKEAKAYLEFFLNPDPESFVKEKFEAIFKEIKRTKRGGLSKGRISVVRSYIKEGIAYGLAPEYVGRLFAGAISLLVSTERYIYYPASLFNGTYKLVADYLIWANKNSLMDSALENLTKITTDPAIGTEMFRRNVTSIIDSTVRNIKNSGI